MKVIEISGKNLTPRLVPFNDAEASERVIRENKDELACMIVEGMMGSAGQIPPRDGYLERLRKVTRENGVLLILDEVVQNPC